MKSFKVGDRVRIVCEGSDQNGLEATIYEIEPWYEDDEAVVDGNAICGDMAFLVDVDGDGKGDGDVVWAYDAHELEPIVNPDEAAWTEFKRYLQPDPIILAKEPA